MSMQCILEFDNGLVLHSDDNVDRSAFNNPSLKKVNILCGGKTFSYTLEKDMRFIFFKEFSISSPTRVTYCFGYQKTVRGRNVKVIIKMDENGNMVMGDGR